LAGFDVITEGMSTFVWLGCSLRAVEESVVLTTGAKGVPIRALPGFGWA
jgi:hypothetical protein